MTDIKLRGNLLRINYFLKLTFACGTVSKCLGLQDPDLSLFERIRIRILPSTSIKLREKPQFQLFCDFFLNFYL